MPRSSLIFAAIGACAVAYAVYVHVESGARVSQAQGSLEWALVRERALADGLRKCETRSAAATACAESTARDCSEAAGDLADVLVAPDGRRLVSPEERDAFRRKYLQRRIDRAFPDETLRDELHGLQEELRELSGLGPAELLDAAGAREAPRALRPHEAEAVQEGEERKRFADEISRRLGVARPGSRELLEDGEWHER